MRRTLILATAILMASTACGGDSVGNAGMSGTAGNSGTGNNGTGDQPIEGDEQVVDLGPDEIVLTSGLVRFDGCDALLDYLHTEYSPRVTPWGFDRGGWFGPMRLLEGEMEMAAEAMAENAAGASPSTAAPATTAAPVEGVDFSGTNVQELGVDEADIVKTDGRRIITLSAGRLVVVDAESRREVGSVAVAEGWMPEMFLHGDSLLLIVRSTSDAPDGSETLMQRIDLSGDSPEIVETLSVQGNYVSARSVGGTARVILRYDPQWNFPFVYPQSSAGEQTALDANRAAVLNSTLDDWLPHYTTGAADSSTGSRLTPCDNVHAPSEFSGFGLTTVISVPIDGAFDPATTTAVTAPGDTVYASVESLYLATTLWVDAGAFEDETTWEEAWQQRRTSIHRFDITGAANAVYEASGEVLGVIHNQFSLSEHAGHLRVVTTVGGPRGDGAESHVRVLSTDGDILSEVGSVGNIGNGEQVQSVRFVGDVGYVVTFRQVDPFYTIDLSDPANPAILGELKIPGFSSYLHPIGDGLVLGVGSDADEDGRITGAKVSLFDVSDLAAPREVAVWTAPDGWNDVGWDHRAFLWWAPQSLAVIPVTVWDDWSGAVVLRVADGTITEVGRVDHVVEGEEPGQTDCRRLTEADLGAAGEVSMEDFETELQYFLMDDYNAVLACEPGESGMTGFECYQEPLFDEEADRLDLLADGESVSICWPNSQPNVIVRSIVISDELWTLGFQGWGGFYDAQRKSRLHANDLSTLERLAALEL